MNIEAGFEQPGGDGVGQEVMVLMDRPAHHPEAPAPMGVPFSHEEFDDDHTGVAYRMDLSIPRLRGVLVDA